MRQTHRDWWAMYAEHAPLMRDQMVRLPAARSEGILSQIRSTLALG